MGDGVGVDWGLGSSMIIDHRQSIPSGHPARRDLNYNRVPAVIGLNNPWLGSILLHSRADIIGRLIT